MKQKVISLLFTLLLVTLVSASSTCDDYALLLKYEEVFDQPEYTDFEQYEKLIRDNPGIMNIEGFDRGTLLEELEEEMKYFEEITSDPSNPSYDHLGEQWKRTLEGLKKIEEILERNGYNVGRLDGNPRKPNLIYSRCISINEGWNLLPAVAILHDMANLKLNYPLFFYSQFENKYCALQIDEDREDKYDFQKCYTESLESNGVDMDNYMWGVSGWFYSDSESVAEIPIETWEQYKNLDSINLNMGWNLLPIKEFMIGRSFEDIKGDCNIQKVYFYNTKYNEWEEFDINDDLSDYYVRSLNKGLAIKTSNQCTIGNKVFTNLPPTLPLN